MADVFLSYKRDERAAVEKIAASLRSLGLSVWFDTSISVGDTFSDEIDRELNASKAVLVCWSPEALTSSWIKAEALAAFNQNKLACCYVAGVDRFSLPMPFNTVHAGDLREWLQRPSYAHPEWKAVMRSIGKLCSRKDIETWGGLDAQSSVSSLEAWVSDHKNSPLFLTVDAALRMRQREEKRRQQREQEALAERTLEEAARSARKKMEEEAKRAVEKRQAEDKAREERRRRSLPNVLLGSVLAIPIFAVVYGVVAALAFFGLLVLQWLHAEPGGGITRMAELFAGGASGYWGVQAGRSAIGAMLSAWSGWPTFLLSVAGWGSGLYWLVAHTDLRITWWLLIVAAVHTLFAAGVSFFWIARKGSPS